MRTVIQRVKEANVRVGEEVVGNISDGILVFLGVGKDDNEYDVEYFVDKVLGLRIFEDENRKMNLSVHDIKGEILVVSQFTLYGDCRRGRRPSFEKAASSDDAEKLYNSFVKGIKESGLRVQAGKFGALMDIQLVNHGPVTILLESNKLF